MTNSQSTPTSGEKPLEIRRGRVDSLTLFEVTDGELQTLERGSPNSVFLNFAIFFISSAVSFLITLLTVAIESNRTFTAFLVFTVLFGIAGVVLLVLWWRTRNEVSEALKAIRQRIQDPKVVNGNGQTEG